MMVSVCIPVYNSEKTLREVCDRTVQVLSTLTDKFEIILVDDGSSDDSWHAAEELHRKDRRIKIIQLARNFGQHNALMCAFHYVKGDYIVTIDDDLQIAPEDIPKLFYKIQEGHDVVYGTYLRKQHDAVRNFGSSLIQFVFRKVFRVSVGLTSFRIIKKEIVRSILTYNMNFTFIDGFLAWYTKHITSVQVSHSERAAGRSGYRFGQLAQLSLNMLTNFSISPLQAASITGLSFSIFGFILGFYFFIKKIFFGIPIMGFAATGVLITIFSGVQLLSLGLIGEYVGRVHLNLNKKPQFVVRQILD